MSSSNDDEHNVPTERGRQGAAVGVQERDENRQQVLLELTAGAASGSMEGEKSSPR
jgi:hypothetical protein